MNARSLVLVDIENLVLPTPRLATEASTALALRRVARVAELDFDDLVVVACGPRLMKRAGFGIPAELPGARLLVRPGIDGADRALCDELLDPTRIGQRFDRLVIASGDHEFAQRVHPIAAEGVWTLAVSWPDRLSRALRMAVHEVRYLSDSEHDELAAVAA